jgi:hypothetical protein
MFKYFYALQEDKKIYQSCILTQYKFNRTLLYYCQCGRQKNKLYILNYIERIKT